MVKAYGIDISKYQISFNPPAETPLPIDFVIQRLSYGLMRDEKIVELYTPVKKIPLRGAYHYFSSGSPWKDQADFFEMLVSERDFHFVALDFESAYNQKSRDFSENAGKFLAQMRQSFPDKRALLYTNPSIYKNWMMPYSSWMTAYPLWISNPRIPSGPDRVPGMKGMDRVDYEIYQYEFINLKGRKYGVESWSLDMDVSRRSYDDFRDWLGASDTPLPTPPPDIDTWDLKFALAKAVDDWEESLYD
ncbi:MAG: hypothetical protein JRD69_09890 [Deltaproteobacteria bacterium]|nr:hypothetical protein [Deltaproteobacteria bacterium]